MLCFSKFQRAIEFMGFGLEGFNKKPVLVGRPIHSGYENHGLRYVNSCENLWILDITTVNKHA